MDPCRGFGENVRRLRRGRAMTQETLAHLTGIHPTYLSGIERGARNVALRNIVALAGALGVPVGELFEGVEPPASAED